MAYIGKQPTVGNFVKLDAITTSATTTFNLTNGGVAYYPQSPNHCLVSLNGILQAPTDSFTISGSTIIFSSALTTSDVIDFIIVLGDVLNIGTPSDNTVSLAKLTATGTKDSTTFLRGDNSFAVPPAGAMVFLAETSASNVASVDLNGYFTSSYDNYVVYLDGIYGSASSQTMMQFATTGSYTVQTSSYYGQCHYAYGDGTSFSSNESQYYNSTYVNISVATSTTSTQTSNAVVTIWNPMGSNSKSYSGNFSAVNSNISWIASGSCGGRWNSTTAVTGLRFLQSSGNIYARKIRLYGIKNS